MEGLTMMRCAERYFVRLIPAPQAYNEQDAELPDFLFFEYALTGCGARHTVPPFCVSILDVVSHEYSRISGQGTF
jgi:hypothetical protein